MGDRGQVVKTGRCGCFGQDRWVWGLRPMVDGRVELMRMGARRDEQNFMSGWVGLESNDAEHGRRWLWSCGSAMNEGRLGELFG